MDWPAHERALLDQKGAELRDLCDRLEVDLASRETRDGISLSIGVMRGAMERALRTSPSEAMAVLSIAAVALAELIEGE